MDELTKIRKELRIILRNQVTIVNLIGALTKEATGKIPIVSVEIEDIIGVTSTIAVMPTIQNVTFCQEASDCFSLSQE